MDLTLENQNFEDKNKDDQDSMASSITSILDVSRLELDNEETWLYKVPLEASKPENNVADWLQTESTTRIQPEALDVSKTLNKTPKIIDTRTFTRPKKRYTRPTISQIYSSDNSETNDMMSSSNEMLKKSADSGVFSNELIHESSEASTPQKPLHFDLAQPSSSFYFDNVLARSGELDSFQNMSPPSLVNSLCSSTFANLMESSFIKNDPVLREIRDTDYTPTVLLQDIEPQLYNSITESLSSINSDTPEGFLKKVSANNSFRRSLERSKINNCDNTFDIIRAQEMELEQCDNDTLIKSYGLDQSQMSTTNEESSQSTIVKNSHTSLKDVSSENVDINATYSRKSLSKLRDSQKSENDSGGVLNGTYRRSLNRTKELNTTFDIESFDHSVVSESDLKPAQSIEEILDAKVSQTFGANFSGTYRKSPKSNGTFRKSDIAKATVSLNSTFDVSNDDQLDVSDNIESFETIENNLIEDAIVKEQEPNNVPDINRLSYCLEENVKSDSNQMNTTVNIKRFSLGSADSLDRMSSISGSSKGSNKLVNLDMAEVDAIVEMQERSLDQVMSTPKPNMGGNKLFDNHFISPIVNRGSSESVSSNDGYRGGNRQKAAAENFLKQPKSLGYLGNKLDSKLKATHRSAYTLPVQKPLQALPNNARTNLRAPSYPTGSLSNLSRPVGSRSNLGSMAPKLKGSYTSLKPVNANLPVAPPPPPKTTGSSQTRIVQVQPMPRDKGVVSGGDSTFVKPQIPRASGLPRPTGIPRPTSKIPAPRSSNLRPTSARYARQNVG